MDAIRHGRVSERDDPEARKRKEEEDLKRREEEKKEKEEEQEKKIAEYGKSEADMELEEGFKKANEINKHYGLPDVERKQPEAKAGGPQAGLH